MKKIYKTEVLNKIPTDLIFSFINFYRKLNIFIIKKFFVKLNKGLFVY